MLSVCNAIYISVGVVDIRGRKVLTKEVFEVWSEVVEAVVGGQSRWILLFRTAGLDLGTQAA